MRPLTRVALLACLVAATAGCGARDQVTDPASSYGPNDLVLRIEGGGGLAAPDRLLTSVPFFNLYGDGRVITTGPVPAIYPGPALPNLQVSHVGPFDPPLLAKKALDAGVGSADAGELQIADGGWTRFTVLTEGGEKSTQVTELNTDEGLTRSQKSAREKLRKLLDELTGNPAVDRSTPYVATEVAVSAIPWSDPGDPSLPPPPPIAWPGPGLPGPGLDNGPTPQTPCLVVTGDQAAAVLAAAAKANSLTPWTSGGKTWRVGLRPLLPDEHTCADLNR
jgi:hypothetical protein